jgi:putative tricarboxylic transport membrane protein
VSPCLRGYVRPLIGLMLSHLVAGFAVALTPANLLWGFAGVTLGTMVGVLPGIGPALTVALLLPVTYGLDPTAALIMFAGIYYGAMYGGSTTSILLNTPGESATIVTALDGHQMARSGRGGAALATAAIGSFVAGTLATLALSLTAPIMVRIALSFGPAEYFALMVLAFVMVTTVLGRSSLAGWMSLLLGLTLGSIGIDSLSGQSRLTFGIPYLLDGIDPVIVAIGLFAVGETLWVISRGPEADEIVPVRGSLWMTPAEWSRSWKPWLRGAAIGFPMGALPAGGAELPTLMSYAMEKRLSPRPEEFGRGAIEGVAGPEAANNASAAGTLVPLLTLGLPTSATAAVLLAAFQQFGLQPGPLLFEHEPALVWGVIASLYVGNAMLLILNLPLVGFWVKLLSIPRPWLYGGILVVATLGAFSVHRSAGDLLLVAMVGVIGFALRLLDAPVAPVMIGLILGPAAEQHLRRALAISQNDPTVFFTRPIAAGLLVSAAAVVLWAPTRSWVTRAAVGGSS